MTRFRHFMNTVRTNWSDQPAARGAAKMAAGAVLVAEGLFGVVSNRVRRNSSKTGGLFGGITTVILGVVFMVVGATVLTPDVPDDEQVTTGTVIDVRERTNSDGDRQYSPLYAYEVDGRDYTLQSSVSSSNRPSLGSEVDIGYSASNPDRARRIGGLEGNMHRIFFGVGAFVFLVGVFHVLFSILLIGFGIKLFNDGREDRAAAGDEKQGFFEDIFSLAKRVSKGEVDVSTTAAGTTGSSAGAPDQAFSALFGGGQPVPQAQPVPQTPPAPAGPPAGWYPAPDGSGNQQWWDGTGWTEHLAPPSRPPG